MDYNFSDYINLTTLAEQYEELAHGSWKVKEMPVFRKAVQFAS